MAPQLFELIAGIAMESEPAVLSSYRRHAFAAERFPGLIPGETEDRTTGIAIHNITEPVWRLLDEFESDMYRREDVSVKLLSGRDIAAQTYVLEPRYRHLLADHDWDFENFLTFHLASYLTRLD